MKETWRWFGPSDPISIADIKQTGASGVVSALHHVPNGQVWTVEEIIRRQSQIERLDQGPSGLTWDVVESLPVSEAIKSQKGPVKEHFEAYRQSIRNLAKCGIHTVCYNFMPALDWTRTRLSHPLPNGGYAMAFDIVDFVAFDCFILKRKGAKEDYSVDVLQSAGARFSTMNDAKKTELSNSIIAGLPGANDSWSLGQLQERLGAYATISEETFRGYLLDFLSEIVLTAEEVGVRLCCHPDDPPFSLLGIPRVLSAQRDYEAVFNAVDSPANGATLCTGSLGVSKDFDVISFIEKLGDRIHFVHLRNTKRSPRTGCDRYSFVESEHLFGDTDMVGAVSALLSEETKRRHQGRADWEVPMRPDHGHALLSDRDREAQPGYPLIGRLRGLAELRGVMLAVQKPAAS
ncbi:MAG: mannonate dehydratase [Pseudomonadota bacterium]